MTNYQDLLGQRCLFRINAGRWAGSDPIEYRVVEIAPSSTLVKLRTLGGSEFWKSIAALEFVEALPAHKQGNPT